MNPPQGGEMRNLKRIWQELEQKEKNTFHQRACPDLLGCSTNYRKIKD
jgi:hypothetical protein